MRCVVSLKPLITFTTLLILFCLCYYFIYNDFISLWLIIVSLAICHYLSSSSIIIYSFRIKTIKIDYFYVFEFVFNPLSGILCLALYLSLLLLFFFCVVKSVVVVAVCYFTVSQKLNIQTQHSTHWLQSQAIKKFS